MFLINHASSSDLGVANRKFLEKSFKKGTRRIVRVSLGEWGDAVTWGTKDKEF